MKRAFWIVAGCLAVAIAAAVLWPRTDLGQSRYFPNQMYHHLALRAFGEIPYGGADTGEVLATLRHIRAGDSESWFAAWHNTAERVSSVARASRDPISRGRALLRAHDYYRSAEFLLDSNDPRRPETWAKNTRAFYEGLEALQVRYERIVVPYGSHHLNAIYFQGGPGSESRPLILGCGGFDSTMEELYFTIAAGALERGYSVLVFEGPGQGSVLREQGLTFTPEWEMPTRSVLDAFLAGHPKPPHIVFVGMSFGGYLAPRAAAFDTRIDGVVAFDVLFDMAEVGRRATPANALLERLVRMGWLDTADGLIRFGMSRSPDLKWAVTNALWTFGLRRPSEVQAAFVPYTLKDVAKDIRADVLILAGARDHFIPLEQVAQFERSLTQARSVSTTIYDEESGGEEHCQDGAVTLWQMTLFDWIDAKFAASVGRAAG